ncbi:MAG: SDR family oxidoreductase [Myxococcales bacterium]
MGIAGGTTSTETRSPAGHRKPELLGQTVAVIGGSAGIGLETARRAHAEGAKLIVTGRNHERLLQAARELDTLNTAAFDANNAAHLERFFKDLPCRLDHLMVTAGKPYYARLNEMDFVHVRRAIDEHLLLLLQVARHASEKIRPGGTLIFMGGTGARRPAPGLSVIAALTAALPALVQNLALELAPVRVNLIAAGFVDTPLSAALLGDQLDARRTQLRSTLPIQRVVMPADVAALAVHLMANTALTGATFDVDGGQQLIVS